MNMNHILRALCPNVLLNSSTYIIHESVVVPSGCRVLGQMGTVLQAAPEFYDPIIISENFMSVNGTNAWLSDFGVPHGMAIENIKIKGSCDPRENHKFGTNESSRNHGIAFYAKGFRMTQITVMNVCGHGVYSAGSNMGGIDVDKETKDIIAPEAFIRDIRVLGTSLDGFVFRGPHDSLLDNIICAHNRRGFVVDTDGSTFNGAADIGFVHAYGTRQEAILIKAKVKARFLQGDTGTGTGVRVFDSGKSIIGTIESFKTRPSSFHSSPNYAVEICGCCGIQIGSIRVRADIQTNGVLITSKYTQIGSLHVDGSPRHDGMRRPASRPLTGIVVNAQNVIVASMVIVNMARASYTLYPIQTSVSTFSNTLCQPKDWLNGNVMCGTNSHEFQGGTRATQVVFLGDSTMMMLYRSVLQTLNICSMNLTEHVTREGIVRGCQTPQVAHAGRCDSWKYLGIHQQSFTHIADDAGPADYGATHAGCTDCSSCYPMAFLTKSGHRIEYIPLEFSKDERVQTANLRETVDHVALRSTKDTLYVLSLGLHEFAIGDTNATHGKNRITPQMFKLHLKHVIDVLGENLIYVGAQAVRSEAMRQKNARIADLNLVASSLVSRFVPDGYDVSHSPAAQSLYADNIHLKGQDYLFYRRLAYLLLHRYASEFDIFADDV